MFDGIFFLLSNKPFAIKNPKLANVPYIIWKSFLIFFLHNNDFCLFIYYYFFLTCLCIYSFRQLYAKGKSNFTCAQRKLKSNFHLLLTILMSTTLAYFSIHDKYLKNSKMLITMHSNIFLPLPRDS